MKPNEQDVALLEQCYAGRTPFYGELHDHASTGGRSDGKRCLLHWRACMEALGLDFAAILDHRQVRHMYLPLWEDGVFIGGTEPGARISDLVGLCEKASVHYNMLFENAEPLRELLTEFEEYEYAGGTEDFFLYPPFTRERFGQLIDRVREKGGFFVHPHPKQQMLSEDPLHYWFRDETGLEVFYKDMGNEATAANYELWTTLLSLGKRIWACAGGDWHRICNDRALTTIYATEKKNAAYLDRLRVGDFVCGAVGIRMCIGDEPMGGKTFFSGKRLVLSISDFHPSIRFPCHRYRLDLFNDRGVVHSEEFSCDVPYTFALDVSPCRFYRAEVIDLTRDLRIAIGNPIWNTEEML